jgi:hypothetical protein
MFTHVSVCVVMFLRSIITFLVTSLLPLTSTFSHIYYVNLSGSGYTDVSQEQTASVCISSPLTDYMAL